MLIRLVCLAALLLAANANPVAKGIGGLIGGVAKGAAKAGAKGVSKGSKASKGLDSDDWIPDIFPTDASEVPADDITPFDRFHPDQTGGVDICKPPGDHQCAVIAWSSSQVGNVKVVGGNCDNIVADSRINQQEQAPGYSGSFTTTYGGLVLYFGASSLQRDHISGITFQYNGKSYDESRCFFTGGTNGGNVVDAKQCNFDC